jgi:hypothetical protein
MDYKRRDNCRLCGNKDFALVVSLSPTALANEFLKIPEKQETFPLDLYKCKTCNHFQILDIVNPDRLFKKYLYKSSTSQLMRNYFKFYACDVVSKYSLDESSFVVEFGSNDACLLKWFPKLGIKALGVDPAKNIAEKTLSEHGVETIPDFFNIPVAQKIKKDHGLADIIIGNNVFAHADDLNEIVFAVKELLKPGGSFIFDVSYALDMMVCRDFSQMYHEHTSYHTIAPLRLFFEKHNMVLQNVERKNIHGGSIRCHVVNSENAAVYDSVEQNIDHEDDCINLDFTKLTKNGKPYYEYSQICEFIRNTNELKTSLKSFLLDLKSKGKSISALAASAKSTTFLHQCDIGTDIIDYICDDAEDKQNKYTPGKHIPVVPFSKIYETKPDYLLILSFNFTDSLIKKYKSCGSKFIIPVPEIKVI